MAKETAYSALRCVLLGTATLIAGCGPESLDPFERTSEPSTPEVSSVEDLEEASRFAMGAPPPSRASTSGSKNGDPIDPRQRDAHNGAERMRALENGDHHQEIDEEGSGAGDQEMAGVRETGFNPNDGSEETGDGDDRNAADDDEADDDEMAGVRETGFREGEDEMAGVRETGFLDAPDLRISSMDGTIALLEWTPLEEVQRYVITGQQFNYDSETSSPVRIEVSGTTYALETHGLRTLVRVRAVDEEGNSLSKPSNTVEISGT